MSTCYQLKTFHSKIFARRQRATMMVPIGNDIVRRHLLFVRRTNHSAINMSIRVIHRFERTNNGFIRCRQQNDDKQTKTSSKMNITSTLDMDFCHDIDRTNIAQCLVRVLTMNRVTNRFESRNLNMYAHVHRNSTIDVIHK
jgi:hypothetical protein